MESRRLVINHGSNCRQKRLQILERSITPDVLARTGSGVDPVSGSRRSRRVTLLLSAAEPKEGRAGTNAVQAEEGEDWKEDDERKEGEEGEIGRTKETEEQAGDETAEEANTEVHGMQRFSELAADARRREEADRRLKKWSDEWWELH